MSGHAHWFEMPSPFAAEPGTLLMLEPAWADADALQAQLLDESYPRPFVIEDGERRQLFFSLRLTQSAMRIHAPNELELSYTQKMMAFLLFKPRPRRIALIGLGGGSLLKFCFHRLPAAQITAVELDPDVIAWRDVFCIPPDGPRLQILQGDGVEFLTRPENGMDVLLVDAFDQTGVAPSLASEAFFDAVRARLSGDGVLVVNLAGDKSGYAGLVSAALDAFDERVIVFHDPEDGNHILLAFAKRDFEPRWRWVHNQARELRSKYGLDFPAFAQHIERAARQELAARLAR